MAVFGKSGRPKHQNRKEIASFFYNLNVANTRSFVVKANPQRKSCRCA